MKINQSKSQGATECCQIYSTAMEGPQSGCSFVSWSPLRIANAVSEGGETCGV
ncbi:MAG: hypothetical protein KKB31_07315 [Nanoarchaeota archaeon]|nr:hypothetical protein [Nanoarchaeota archaeon]